MNSRSKYLLKNTGILTISNFASKILVFLLVPLYTSVLSTEDVGIYDLTVSTITLLYPILTMNIADGVMRFTMDKVDRSSSSSCAMGNEVFDTDSSRYEIISIAMRYISLSWIVGAGLLITLRATGLVPQIEGYEVIIYLYFFFYILNQLLVQFSKGLERVADMGIAGVIGTVAMLAGNLMFLLVFKIGLRGFFLANVMAQVLPSVYLFVRLRFWKYLWWKDKYTVPNGQAVRNKQLKIQENHNSHWNYRNQAYNGSHRSYKINSWLSINKQLRHEMLVYSVPLIATTLGWWVNSTSDKYVVAFICGVGANGLLSVSYKIPSIINTLQGIFIQAWQISAIKEYGEKDTARFYGRAFTIINVLMCAVCSWLILLTKPLASVLYQKDFYTAWQYVPLLIISCVLNSASGFLGPILSAKKASKPMAMSAVYGASANVVMNIVLVYLIGIQGASIATVISSFIIYAVRKKAVGDEIKIGSYGILVITWALLCVQAVLEIYTTFWWLEIVLMAAMLILNWNGVKEILGKGKSILKKR